MTYIRETLPTAQEWTFVWLITRVGSTMHRQCTALYEGLVARLVVARVRSFIGVYPIMTLEVGLSIKALS